MDVGERIVTHIAPVVVECEKKNYEIVFLGILKKGINIPYGFETWLFVFHT